MPPPTKQRHLHKKSPLSAPKNRLGQGMMFIAWAILLIMFFQYFKEQEAEKFNPNRELESSIIGNRKAITLRENSQHHFVMNGKINGHTVVFLIDTGATNVAIPEHIAQRLKLPVGNPSIAETANGTVRVYNTYIEKLQLGDIALHNVSAQINPGMNHMQEILLGMSALSQVEFTQKNGTLTITQ